MTVRTIGDTQVDQYAVAVSNAQPWHVAGYVFVTLGVALAGYAAVAYLLGRLRTWRASRPVKLPTPPGFATTLGDRETARLLRVAAGQKPYAVEISAEAVVVRLAGIDAPAPAAPWAAADGGAEDAGLIRTAKRDRLVDAAEAEGHPFIALGTSATGVVFIDPAHSPGLISIDGEREAARALAATLRGQSDAARFTAGPGEGAQWRWTLGADGVLDTGVLGLRVQTTELAAALAVVETAQRRNVDADEAVARTSQNSQNQNSQASQSGQASQRRQSKSNQIGRTARTERTDQAEPSTPPQPKLSVNKAVAPSRYVQSAPTKDTQQPVPAPAKQLLDRLDEPSPAAVKPTTSAKVLALSESAAESDLDLDAVSAADAAGQE